MLFIFICLKSYNLLSFDLNFNLFSMEVSMNDITLEHGVYGSIIQKNIKMNN
ncbi:hypothetical protein BHWA1_01624 [Brachyspira hyodysenteriae WA1]|uniref:Uncharacterized protein n=1 Tax=Brachyspira hyodysenteriae (strain ATCC 49526 / WA1) TaxID=565034 RepID=A0A3B6VGF9_BRAHW|nr:hypothetical protein BHWA1_01624 [Brachyspira hyodysenteriae WA1]